VMRDVNHITLVFYLCSSQISPSLYFLGPHNRSSFLVGINVPVFFTFNLGSCED